MVFGRDEFSGSLQHMEENQNKNLIVLSSSMRYVVFDEKMKMILLLKLNVFFCLDLHLNLPHIVRHYQNCLFYYIIRVHWAYL